MTAMALPGCTVAEADNADGLDREYVFKLCDVGQTKQYYYFQAEKKYHLERSRADIILNIMYVIQM